MFNSNCNLSLDMIDRYLSHIKFSQLDSNTCQIDRWIFENNLNFKKTSKPNYDIKWVSSDNTQNLAYAKTDYDKKLIVEAMIQIMNETPDEFVNFKSYNILAEWYLKYEGWLIYYETINNKKINELEENLLD